MLDANLLITVRLLVENESEHVDVGSALVLVVAKFGSRRIVGKAEFEVGSGLAT